MKSQLEVFTNADFFPDTVFCNELYTVGFDGTQVCVFKTATGELLQKAKSEKAELLTNFAIIKSNGKVGGISYDGMLTLFPGYDNLKITKQGILVMRRVKGVKKYGFYTWDKKCVLPSVYDSIFIESSYVIVEEKNKYSVHSYDGYTLLTDIYDYIMSFGEYMLVYRNNKVGICKNDGHFILPIMFKQIDVITGIGIKVKDSVTNKYGLYSFSGKQLIPCKCNQMLMYNSEVLKYYVENVGYYFFKDGCISIAGETITEKNGKYTVYFQRTKTVYPDEVK